MISTPSSRSRLPRSPPDGYSLPQAREIVSLAPPGCCLLRNSSCFGNLANVESAAEEGDDPCLVLPSAIEGGGFDESGKAGRSRPRSPVVDGRVMRWYLGHHTAGVQARHWRGLHRAPCHEPTRAPATGHDG